MLKIHTTDRHGRNALAVEVAATPESEAAALAFLRRVTAWEIGDYRVIDFVEDEGTDPIGAELLEFLSPTCEHGLSLMLCAGPGHYPADM